MTDPQGGQYRLPLLGLLGAVVVVLLIVQSSLDADPIPRDAIEVGVSLVLGGTLVATEYWMVRQEFEPEHRSLVGRYALIGGLGMVVLAGWFVVIQASGGQEFEEPLVVIMGASSIGAVGGMLVGFSHVRTRRALRQAERERERLDEFASALAHDLRNPINVAQAILLDLGASEAADDRLDEAMAALDRMNDLIDDTLLLARDREAVSDTVPVALETAARDAWQGVGDTAAADLDLAADLGVVAADAGRLRRLFENLFRNAVEHAGPDVTVHVGALDDGFYVADDGPGVPQNKRDAVWKRGHSLTDGGSGLGLAIVEAIGTAHGWDLSLVESDDGGVRIEIRDVEWRESPP